MKSLKSIGIAILGLLKELWHTPRTIAQAVQRKQRQGIVNEQEAERLDRIRNPSKYLGK